MLEKRRRNHVKKKERKLQGKKKTKQKEKAKEGMTREEKKERERERQNSIHIPDSPALKLYFHLVIFQGNLGGPPKVLDILMHFSSFTYTQAL